ncbi:class I SAM-dependent methyltransferase [Alkalihalobacterium alkalinitrilicum]|uniref:class I SAM-dependent methyltransferase n=1 Tax=Alkalihalobacterium alkalinitrilicum TaxID=427920 RepID=UPI000994EEEE|nr:class I SAM-dependent methyltransferase [Alkalihalobacterium alkalinitrilicum]
MKLDGILPYTRILLEKAINSGDIAIDCTAGNGHDTSFLANRVGENGHVYSFDIQKTAIEKTTKRIREQELLNRVTLFHKSHDQLTKCIPAHHQGMIKGAIFNLGYLPGGDKEIVTTPHSTLSAIEQLIEMLDVGGIIVLVIYHGHDQGKFEKEAVVRYAEQLNQEKTHVLKYEFINQKNNPPFIVAIEKR